MKTHHLKTWPEYFEAVKSGAKPFEIRHNDRTFEVGDILKLNEYLPETDTYSGEVLTMRIDYILDKHAGLKEGYCIMALTSAPAEEVIDEMYHIK